MRRLPAVALVMAISGTALANYEAVCAPMRTGPPKKPHSEWQGPCRSKYDDAKKDADDHNKQFPGHGARVMGVVDCEDASWRF
jgi:hypothetical protein